jgi:transcriptional regulator with XRE-family HTH domain
MDKYMAILMSISDWELVVGEQIRRLRIANEMDQAQLASAANTSVGSIKNLENGKGSSLRTLILVVRALDAERWLNNLSPSISISPMQMLRDQKLSAPRRRVYKKRESNV